jgi:hypothetical protein
MSWRRSLRSEEAPSAAPTFARALSDDEALITASEANAATRSALRST